MKSLPAFSIKLWDKTEEVFSLVAWREREQAILLLDAARCRKILKPLLPQLDQKVWHYISNPYPDAQPARMEGIRLLCPPCRGNAQQAAKINASVDAVPFLFDSAGSSACEWEKVCVECGDEVLWPKPEDAAPLHALVEQFKARKQEEYEARKQKLARLIVGEFHYLQITKEVDGLCASLPANSDTLRRYVREESFHLDFEINQPLSEATIGRGDAGSLTSRLRIEQEYSELMCSYLRDEWARKHGLNLAAMEQERLRFLRFVRKHATNVMERVPPALDWKDLFSGQKRESTGQRPGLQLAPQEELVLCAQVRHVLIFSDGSRVWLAPSRLRPPHANEEHEFDACLGAGEAGRLEAVIPKLAAERQKLEAVPVEIAARAKDLGETLGKFADVFADPLVAAARDASIARGVPPLFAWWVFQERHHNKFPTVDGALRRCGLGKQLEEDGFGFSRPTVGRWLKIIYEELVERKLMPKRSPGRGAIKAPAQAKDAGPLPGDEDEPPDDFVEWVQDKHAAGAIPSEENVLDWLGAHADSSALDSCRDDKLREIAKKWLKQAAKILGLDQTDSPEPEDDNDLRDGD